jgi:hypothetical protein
MLFAMTFYEQSILSLIVVTACLIHFGKKIAASNGPVSTAAKDFAAQKTLGFFGRFLK